MMSDILTVFWKEWQVLFSWQSGNTRRSGPLTLIIMLAVFGVLIPVQSGAGLASSPLIIGSWIWTCMVLVGSIVAPSFAGERENHTLESLLATRLSDRAILFGKLVAVIAYGWGIAVLSAVVGLVTLNVISEGGGLVLYPSSIVAGGLVYTLLVAGLYAAVGMLISLHAASVRQAQQVLSVANLVLVFGAIYGLQALPPQVQLGLVRALEMGVAWLPYAIAVALLVVDILLLLVSMAQFQRTRLILD